MKLHTGKGMVIANPVRRRCSGGYFADYGLSTYVLLCSVASYPSQTNNNPPPSPTDHWHDVLVGSILGTLFAYFSYRQYYPSLSSELSHRPYSPRIKDDVEAVLPFHRRNDSESAPVANQGPKATSDSAHRRQESASQQQPLTARVEREEDYELEGTAPRPGGPGHLHDVWSEGRKDEV